MMLRSGKMVLWILLLLCCFVMQTCKKQHENNRNFRYHYTVDYTADKKILGYVKMEGGDTLEHARYTYLDTLVLLILETKGARLHRKWYHLDGEYAWLSLDSSFDESGICVRTEQILYTYNAQNFCIKQFIKSAYWSNGAFVPLENRSEVFDSIDGNNIDYSLYYYGYWRYTNNSFWELTTSINFDNLKDQFVGRRDKNLLRYRSQQYAHKDASYHEFNYSYYLDAHGAMLEKHELETITAFSMTNQGDGQSKVRRDYYYTYNLK